MTATVTPLFTVPATTFRASRLILNGRGEAVRVLRHENHVSVEVHVLTDRIAPELAKAGFVSELELSRLQAAALICAIADAFPGMTAEVRGV